MRRDLEMDEVCEIIRDSRREKRRCAQLLYFMNRLEGLYKTATGKNFRYLRKLDRVRNGGNIVKDALLDIRDAMREPDIGISGDLCADIDFSRDWKQMSLADMELFNSCLKYSLLDEFLLIHYDDTVMWRDWAKYGIEDVWGIYGGLLQECRSAVVNLDIMEYALLPYAKFRNLNESPEYSKEAVTERIARAGNAFVEFSDKLDGSMIQMRYLSDDRFWKGILVASSGSLYPQTSRQLADALAYLQTSGEQIREMVQAEPYLTFIFEWIDGKNDPHIVHYDEKDFGLYLVGLRDYENGSQWPYDRVIKTAEKFGVKHTRVYSMTLDEVMESLDKFSGAEKEGYVLNVDGFLVKIKCPDFVGLMKDAEASRSFNTIIRYVVSGTIDDYIAALPAGYRQDALEKVRKIRQYEQAVLSRVEAEFQKIPAGADRKTAMIRIDEIPDGTGVIKGMVRARYLGKEVGILAKKKGESVQYLRESDIDRYLGLEGALPE